MTIKWYLNALVKLANKSFCRRVSIQSEYSTEYMVCNSSGHDSFLVAKITFKIILNTTNIYTKKAIKENNKIICNLIIQAIPTDLLK